MDGTFCHAALKGKIQIKEQLPKYLGGAIQLGRMDLELETFPFCSFLGVLPRSVEWSGAHEGF